MRLHMAVPSYPFPYIHQQRVCRSFVFCAGSVLSHFTHTPTHTHIHTSKQADSTAFCLRNCQHLFLSFAIRSSLCIADASFFFSWVFRIVMICISYMNLNKMDLCGLYLVTGFGWFVNLYHCSHKCKWQMLLLDNAGPLDERCQRTRILDTNPEVDTTWHIRSFTTRWRAFFFSHGEKYARQYYCDRKDRNEND